MQKKKSFHDCLHQKPYKENSYTIWSRWELLKLKCFAYMPCNENETDDEFSNIHANKLNRQTGTCKHGAQVMVFDSTDDYVYYMRVILNKKQLFLVNTKQYLLLKKKNCFNFAVKFCH